jgi:hypothetical protein
MAATQTFETTAPAHVAAEFVRDFDYRHEPLFLIDPHRAFVRAWGLKPTSSHHGPVRMRDVQAQIAATAALKLPQGAV